MNSAPETWTRRRLLRTLPGILTPLLFPAELASLVKPSKSALFSRFVDVSASAGLTEPIVYGDPAHNTYIVEVAGGGCAFFDYDNDGWMDVFIVGGRRLESVPPDSGNRLYHNNRDGTFTDVTAKAGLLHSRTYFGSGCTFVDYNRDGLLDLFISNYVDIDLATAPKPSLDLPNCQYEGVPINCGPKSLGFPPMFLYRNHGDGTFTDVSKDSGIGSIRGSYALTAVAFDADEDGWPDIFVACDATPSYLLMNNRDGTFREEGMLRGVALGRSGEPMAGMGVGIGDYDLDGHIDLCKTHFHREATGLYRNNGKGDFEDVSARSGLFSESRFISWGTGMVDLDNDGYPDIFLVTGTVYPELERVYPVKYPARNPRIVFRNQGEGMFVELGEEAGPAIASRHVSRGCAFGDFDNDGDLDILIMNRNEPPTLLRNDAPAGNHWLKVRLEGTKSNRSAIGARVLVRYAGKVQAQCVTSQSSYLSANDPRLHFGLGAATTADIEIHWPTGATEAYARIAADQLVTLREGQGMVKGRPFRQG